MINKVKKNITNSKITTGFGILFLIADLVYLLFPVLFDAETSSTNLTIIAVIGVGLLVAPDNLLSKLPKLK